MSLPLPSLTYNYHQFQIENKKGDQMDTRTRFTPRSYEDFEPSFEWKREEGSDTLVISLPGFKKDQLKVQMDNLGNLRISGERSLADQRWSRFRKDFRIPQNTITSEVRAKFQNENLYVTVPKPIAKSLPQDRPNAQEPESGKKTTMEPKSRENKNRMSQKDSPLSSSKPNGATMTQSNGKSRKTGETDTTKTAPTVQEKERDQIHKPEDKQQPANDTGNKNAELPSSRKRKTVVEDETLHHGGSEMERKVGGLGMRFKKPRQIMLNVGVAAVIFVGLAFYVSYKVRKSIEADNN